MTLHQDVVSQALETNSKRRKLFDVIGHSQKTDTKLYGAYRHARTLLRTNWNDKSTSRTVLNDFQTQVNGITDELMLEAYDIGVEEGLAFFDIYGIRRPTPPPVPQEPVDAVKAAVNRQVIQAKALLSQEDMGAELVIGSDTSAGILHPTQISGIIDNNANSLIGSIISILLLLLVNAPESSEDNYLVQAIATVDSRTTDCCLSVHGQTRPIGGTFTLTGTPRFSDQMARPPFHHYCRTSVALVLEEHKDDRLTKELIESAIAELAKRK